MMRAWLTLAAGLLVCGPAYAAGGVLVPTEGKRIVVLGGELVGGDHQRFKKLIESGGSDVVVLDRPYGRTDEAVLIAAEIRNAGLNTFIPGRGDCSATCAVMFLAGRTKYAVEGALIGIVPNGRVNPTGDRQVSNGAVLEWLGVPESMRSQMASAAGDGPYWVGEAERAQLGIVTVNGKELTKSALTVEPSPERAPGEHVEALLDARTPRPRPLPKRSSVVPLQSAIVVTPTTELPGLRYLTVPEVRPASPATSEGPPEAWPWQAQPAGDLVAAPLDP